MHFLCDLLVDLWDDLKKKSEKKINLILKFFKF